MCHLNDGARTLFWKSIKMQLSLSRNFGILVIFLSSVDAFAAGCVASRGAGIPNSALGFHQMDTSFLANNSSKGEDKESDSSHDSIANNSSGLQATIAYRAFRSDRHFSGKEEHKNRQREGSEVINTSRFVDISLAYTFDEFYSMSLTLPYAYHDRSQVVRANDPDRTILQRFHTQSAGFGDLQLIGTKWVFDPKEVQQGNLALGIGLDMPTGKKDSKDTFMAYDAESQNIIAETRTVDQSIQLGDGGWGVILDVGAYYRMTSQFTSYFNGSYTITPEEKNGVATFRSNPFEKEMSIADTYLARAGVDYIISPKYDLTLSLGARFEGVTVKDLVGGSDGFRRPGYDLSIEPGISVVMDSWLFSLYVPVSIERNRQRSVADKQQTEATGTYRHGDAAFSDYSVSFAISKHY